MPPNCTHLGNPNYNPNKTGKNTYSDVGVTRNRLVSPMVMFTYASEVPFGAFIADSVKIDKK